MEDLEGRAAAMAWDWDADNIDMDEDDGKQWVPMTPQMMRHLDTARTTRIKSPVQAMTPPRRMQVYALQWS